MKSIEKPLTIILVVAFIALTYLWQTEQIGNHTIQVIEPEIVVEPEIVAEPEVVEIDSNSVSVDSTDTIDEEEPYFKSIREEE